MSSNTKICINIPVYNMIEIHYKLTNINHDFNAFQTLVKLHLVLDPSPLVQFLGYDTILTITIIIILIYIFSTISLINHNNYEF